MPSQPVDPPRRAQPPRRPHPELERDRGLARTTIATRWIAAGGIAGVGVFAGLAALSTRRHGDHPAHDPDSDRRTGGHRPADDNGVSLDERPDHHPRAAIPEDTGHGGADDATVHQAIDDRAERDGAGPGAEDPPAPRSHVR